MFPGETTAEDMDGGGRVRIIQGDAWEVGRNRIVILGPTGRVILSKRAIPSKMNRAGEGADQGTPVCVRGRYEFVRGLASPRGPGDVAITDTDSQCQKRIWKREYETRQSSEKGRGSAHALEEISKPSSLTSTLSSESVLSIRTRRL